VAGNKQCPLEITAHLPVQPLWTSINRCFTRQTDAEWRSFAINDGLIFAPIPPAARCNGAGVKDALPGKFKELWAGLDTGCNHPEAHQSRLRVGFKGLPLELPTMLHGLVNIR